MSIKKYKKNSFTIVEIEIDKLDSNLSPELKSEFILLNKSQNKNIIIDLSQVKYCDSSGLSSLLIGNRLCKELEGKLVLSSLQPMVLKLIKISQLDKVLNIVESIEEAELILA